MYTYTVTFIKYYRVVKEVHVMEDKIARQCSTYLNCKMNGFVVVFLILIQECTCRQTGKIKV